MELQPADHSDSNTSMCSPLLVDHSDYDGESVEQAVDLNACTAVEYEQKADAHGMRFVCDEKEGWTPVIGKRSRHKVPTACSDRDLNLLFVQASQWKTRPLGYN